MIEVFALGGYDEIGKNMTAIRIDNDIIIFDIGIHVENYIKFSELEGENLKLLSASQLAAAGVIPDASKLRELRSCIRAIIPTHAHLDHLGGVPFLASKFKAPIICTPYSAAVLESILRDERKKIRNKIIVLMPGKRYRISNQLTLEFINITHSTPQTIMAVLRTKYGLIAYANDFKLDKAPLLGKPINLKKLESLGEEGIKILIMESIYADTPEKTPSEAVARELLKDVLLGIKHDGLIIVTTFSSHLARLKTILECATMLKRKVVFLGRSLARYIKAGQDVGLINFGRAEVLKYRRAIARKLRHITKNKKRYFLIVTGHQGEPGSVLKRIASRELPLLLDERDSIIFSCRVIPTSTNIKNRQRLEEQLKAFRVRIFKDVHCSGHAHREDLREFIKALKPKHIIPAHADETKRAALAELALELGYQKNQIHMLHDLDRLKL